MGPKGDKKEITEREKEYLLTSYFNKIFLFSIYSDRGPKKWRKGPDVGSKSCTTRYQYKDLLKNQKTFEDFGWKKLDVVESELDSSDDCDEGKSNSSGSGFGEDAFQVEVCQNRHLNLSVSQLMRKKQATKNTILVDSESVQIRQETPPSPQSI